MYIPMSRSKLHKPLPATMSSIPDPPEPELGDDRFSRKFKNWREWRNTVDFLTNLHIGVDDSQVFCSPQDPPDVFYQDAAFEVKEIMDEGRRRHKEAKQARNNSLHGNGKSYIKSRFAIDLFPADAAQLVLKHLNSINSRYLPGMKERTDILFYINKINHWFDDGPVPSNELFEPYGWRSVSAVIFNNVSIVFQTSNSAPQFLRDNLGKARLRSEPI